MKNEPTTGNKTLFWTDDGPTNTQLVRRQKGGKFTFDGVYLTGFRLQEVQHQFQTVSIQVHVEPVLCQHEHDARRAQRHALFVGDDNKRNKKKRDIREQNQST